MIDESLISVEEKVTPYYKFTYQEQIKKKYDWLLNDVLKEFTREYMK